MSLLERLELRYIALLADINFLASETTCLACGEPLEEGACWNSGCAEGEQDLACDWAADPITAACYLEVDR